MDEIELKPCPFCGGEAAMIANGACIDATRGEYRIAKMDLEDENDG